MGWKHDKITIGTGPEYPRLKNWLMALMVALLFGALLFVFHTSQLLGDWQQYDPLGVAIMPLVGWSAFAIIRILAYNITFGLHQADVDNVQYIQHQWEEWAGRYLALIHSRVLLPDSLTASQLIKADPQREQHRGQTRRVKWGEEEGLAALLDGLDNILQELPAELPLNLKLLTDSPRDIPALQAEVIHAWKQHISDSYPQPAVQVLYIQSLQGVEDRIKSPEKSAELIVVMQLQGGDRYSDVLALLLLASDDVTTQYQLKHEARLLRPMQLSSAPRYDELELFFTTQVQANHTHYLVGDRSDWAGSFGTLLSAAEKSGGKWEAERLLWLENYTGFSGPLSPWVIAAFTSDVVRLQQVDCLMLSGDQHQCFINTVTTTNQGGVRVVGV